MSCPIKLLQLFINSTINKTCFEISQFVRNDGYHAVYPEGLGGKAA